DRACARRDASIAELPALLRRATDRGRRWHDPHADARNAGGEQRACQDGFRRKRALPVRICAHRRWPHVDLQYLVKQLDHPGQRRHEGAGCDRRPARRAATAVTHARTAVQTSLTVGDATRALLAELRPLDTELVGLDAAPGRVLGRDVSSPLALPPWDNASMDGYAVRAATCVRAVKTCVRGKSRCLPGPLSGRRTWECSRRWVQAPSASIGSHGSPFSRPAMSWSRSRNSTR